jgi:hypothetical protein
LVAGCGPKPKLVVEKGALKRVEREEGSKSKRNRKGSFTQMTMTETENAAFYKKR